MPEKLIKLENYMAKITLPIQKATPKRVKLNRKIGVKTLLYINLGLTLGLYILIVIKLFV